jgi:hypothetical protein
MAENSKVVGYSTREKMMMVAATEKYFARAKSGQTGGALDGIE